MLMKSVCQHKPILEVYKSTYIYKKIFYSCNVTKRSNFIIFSTEKVITSSHKLERMQNTIVQYSLWPHSSALCQTDKYTGTFLLVY